MIRSRLRTFDWPFPAHARRAWLGLALIALAWCWQENAWLLLAIAHNYPELSNLVLLRQCVEHPERETLWQEFMRRFHEHLRAWALQASRSYQQKQILHYREGVDDVVQEVYLRLVQNNCHALRAFKGETEEALFGYLRVITHHVALNRVRENRAKKRPHVTESLDADFHKGQEGRSAHKHAEAIADEPLGLLELQDQLTYWLDKVLHGPQKCRDKMLFQLFYFDGLSAEQIARMPAINMNAHAVEVAVNRVCHRLAKYAKEFKA